MDKEVVFLPNGDLNNNVAKSLDVMFKSLLEADFSNDNNTLLSDGLHLAIKNARRQISPILKEIANINNDAIKLFKKNNAERIKGMDEEEVVKLINKEIDNGSLKSPLLSFLKKGTKVSFLPVSDVDFDTSRLPVNHQIILELLFTEKKKKE